MAVHPGLSFACRVMRVARWAPALGLVLLVLVAVVALSILLPALPVNSANKNTDLLLVVRSEGGWNRDGREEELAPRPEDAEDSPPRPWPWDVIRNPTLHLMHGQLHTEIAHNTPARSDVSFTEYLQARPKEEYGLNTTLSDATPLDRNVPDHRPRECLAVQHDHHTLANASVIIAFHNVWLSALLRSVHSVLNRTPPTLLLEIILVDDGSTKPWLGTPLEAHVARLPKVRLIRHETSQGNSAACMSGVDVAIGHVVVVLQPYFEVGHGWLEPLLHRISQDRRKFVAPVYDEIDAQTHDLVERGYGRTTGFTEGLIEHSIPLQSKDTGRMTSLFDYAATPILFNEIFAVNREYLWELGGFDRQHGAGPYNFELSLRAWQCGGSIETTPCSRIFLSLQLDRTTTETQQAAVLRSKMRLTYLWTGTYGEYFRRALNGIQFTGGHHTDPGPLFRMQFMRTVLKCESFESYLKNVYPEHEFPRNLSRMIGLGSIMNPHSYSCFDTYGPVSSGTKANVYQCHQRGGYQAWSVELMATEGEDAIVHISPVVANTFCMRRDLHLDRCLSDEPAQLWRFVKSQGMIQTHDSKTCLAVRKTDGSIGLVLDDIAQCRKENEEQQWRIDGFDSQRPCVG